MRGEDRRRSAASAKMPRHPSLRAQVGGERCSAASAEIPNPRLGIVEKVEQKAMALPADATPEERRHYELTRDAVADGYELAQAKLAEKSEAARIEREAKELAERTAREAKEKD